MSDFDFYEVVACTLLFLVATTVRGQILPDITSFVGSGPDYQLLPPPESPDGAFTSPNTTLVSNLSKGIVWNVTWYTSYPSVNLYLMNGQISEALTLGTMDTFFVWTVDDAGNNSLPFSFRALNAVGSIGDQTAGGFFTGQFWIQDDSSPLSTTKITSSKTLPTAATRPSSTIPIITTTITTDGSAASTLESSTSTTSPTKTASPSGLSTGTLSAVVVGAVAIFAIIIGASLYFRKQRKPSPSSRHQGLAGIQMTQEGQWGLDKPVYAMQDSSSFHELSVQEKPVELPNHHSSRRHELE